MSLPHREPGSSIPLVEYFVTFQGEGTHGGRSAYFIRTYGCPVKCPWCDSANTWHPDHRPERIERLSVSELARMAAAAKPEFVVVTGGEPAVHNLEPLTRALRAAGLPSHLETSGAFPIQGDFDWITVSPKVYRAPLPENVARADELKLIVESADSINHWRTALGLELIRPGRAVWLHPEWSKREDQATLTLIADTVREHGAPFRAGWQVHKLYQVR